MTRTCPDRRTRLLFSCLVVVPALLSWEVSARGDDDDQLRVGLQPDGRVVVPTNQVLSPAGRQVFFPGRPVDLALIDAGRTLVVKNMADLVFIDVATARVAQIQRLADKGAGLVALHQVDDVPKDLGDFARALLGAAWEQGFSQRAHWVAKFATFPDHPITRGVTPFTIDDGWLFRLRFVPDLAGVTPLLRTVSPKAPAASDSDPGSASIVSWAYDRPGDGRSFVFTGGHLHRSLAEEGYRRFLVNGILWSAHVEVPDSGAPVALAPAALKPTPDPQLPRKDP